MSENKLNPSQMKLLKEIMGDKYAKGPWIGMIYNQHIGTSIDTVTLIKKALDLRIDLQNIVSVSEDVTVEKDVATLDDAAFKVEQEDSPNESKDDLFSPKAVKTDSAKKTKVKTVEPDTLNSKEADELLADF